MPKQAFLRFLPVLLCVLGGFAKADPAPTIANQSWPLRHTDGLFQKKILQEVVAAQSRRDAKAMEAFFSHEDPLVRARAAFAAGSVQSPALVPGLVKLLADSDARVRLDAAFALRQTPKVPSVALMERLNTEEEPEVRAMLLEALGYRGDRTAYDALMATEYPGLERAHVLCAIYYLQRDIVSTEGIERMLKFLDAGNQEVREQAAYFCYVLTRRGHNEPGLAAKLATRVRSYGFDDVRAPHLLRYIACEGRKKDLPLLFGWLAKGVGPRARSVAAEGLKHFTAQADVRAILIRSLGDEHFHVADTAAAVLAECTDLTKEDLAAIKEALAVGKVHPVSRPHLLGLLWGKGEKAFVEKIIEAIPDKDEIGLISALALVPDIELAKVKTDLFRLIASEDLQVQNLVGAYLAARVAHDEEGEELAMFDRFLDGVPDPKSRGEALFELALHLGDRLTSPAGATLFLNYFRYFLEVRDQPSAAACLVILGATREDSVLQILKEGAGEENEGILAEAARGGLELHTKGHPDPINYYKIAFVPVLEIDWEFLRKYGRHPKLVMTTKLGDIVVELDAEQAPMGAQNLIAHAEAGRFDNLYVYRAVPNHVIQAGPQGNFAYRILSEFTRVPKVEHSFGIGDYGKDTANQQIAITHLMRPHNEGKYTNLGLVIEGRKIVKDLAKFDRILKTRVVPDPRW